MTSTIALSPFKYCRLHVASAVTGWSVAAMEAKIHRGEWVLGREFRKCPDGAIVIDLEGFARWVEGRSGPVVPTPTKRRARSAGALSAKD